MTTVTTKRRMDQNLMGLGWQIASTLVVFTLGGYGLDVWLETNPWFLLTGAALGMISIFYQIFKIASDLNREEKRRRREKERDPISRT